MGEATGKADVYDSFLRPLCHGDKIVVVTDPDGRGLRVGVRDHTHSHHCLSEALVFVGFRTALWNLALRARRADGHGWVRVERYRSGLIELSTQVNSMDDEGFIEARWNPSYDSAGDWSEGWRLIADNTRYRFCSEDFISFRVGNGGLSDSECAEIEARDEETQVPELGVPLKWGPGWYVDWVEED